MTATPARRRGVTRRDALIAGAFVVGTNVVGAAPALVGDADTSWIDRPWFFPPDLVFPVVWTLLFTLMGLACYLVFTSGADERAIVVAFGAFGVQFALNLAWTPVFFGLRRPDLGLVVIGLLWVAVLGTIVAFDRVSRRAAWLLVPYLAWATFAAVLNYAIYAGWSG